MSKAVWRAWLLCISVTALAVCLTYPGLSAHAQSPVSQQPQLVYQNPHDGDVLQQPAFGIQLCFASPVNIKDLGAGGDFKFAITEPDGFGLGNRDVFQPDGYGVTVYPGDPIGDSAGQWKFNYRVTSPDAKSALEGDINYTVDPNGSPVPQETPPACVESGGTATAAPGANGSTTSTSGNSNTMPFAFIAIGVVGALVMLVVVFLLLRRKGRATKRPASGPISPIAWSPPEPSAPLVAESRASRAQPSPPPPPPIVASETPLPQSSPPPAAAPPPVVASETPLSESGLLPAAAPPPPVAANETPLPESSPSPTAAPPPAVPWSRPSPPSTSMSPPAIVKSGAPLPESSPPPGFAPPPPIAESGTPLPESSAPPRSETPTEDSVIGSADHSPDNSRYALLATAAAVILLFGIIFRRRRGRDRHRGDDGKHD